MNCSAKRAFSALALLAALSTSSAAQATPIFSEGEAKPNRFWWPNQLNLDPLRAQNPTSNPYGDALNYAEAFEKLDLDALKAERKSLHYPDSKSASQSGTSSKLLPPAPHSGLEHFTVSNLRQSTFQ